MDNQDSGLRPVGQPARGGSAARPAAAEPSLRPLTPSRHSSTTGSRKRPRRPSGRPPTRRPFDPRAFEAAVLQRVRRELAGLEEHLAQRLEDKLSARLEAKFEARLRRLAEEQRAELAAQEARFEGRFEELYERLAGLEDSPLARARDSAALQPDALAERSAAELTRQICDELDPEVLSADAAAVALEQIARQVGEEVDRAALREQVVTQVAERLSPELADSLEAEREALEAGVRKRALDELLTGFRAGLDEDRLRETVAGEATRAAQAEAKGRLEEISREVGVRVCEEILSRAAEAQRAEIEAKLDVQGALAGAQERIAQEAAQAALAQTDLDPVLRDLESLPGRLEERVLGTLQAGLEVQVQTLVKGALAQQAPSEAASRAPSAETLRALEEKLAAGLAALREELAQAAPAGLSEEDQDQLCGTLYRRLKTDLAGAPSPALAAGETAGEVSPVLFKALAREVKGLKQSVGKMLTSGAEDLLTSPEAKQILDAQLRQVLDYVRDEVVPKAVERTLEER